MITIKQIRIQEFRGIRDLTLDIQGKNYAVYGPNGTGKSGVVDAIEFALTGNLSRMSGPGTGGINTIDHGPHVDKKIHLSKPLSLWISMCIHREASKTPKSYVLLKRQRPPQSYPITIQKLPQHLMPLRSTQKLFSHGEN